MEEQVQTMSKKENPLGYQPIGRLLMRFALPAIISMLVNALYNIVDQIFIGQGIGYLGNAATTIAFPIVTIILAASTLLGAGASAFAAIKLGEKQEETAEKCLGNVFLLGILMGIIVLVLGLIFLDPMLKLFGATENTMDYARQYTSILLIGAPFNMLGVILSNMARTDGNPTLATYSMVIGAVLNTILDPIYIFVFHWGEAGAAIATALSKLVSFLVLISPYLRGRTMIALSIRQFHPSKVIMNELVKMGFPTFARSALMTLASIITNNIAGAFSVSALAAISVVNRIMIFISSAVLGFGQGYQPVAGFNWGAKRYDRVKSAFWFAAGVSVACVSALGLAAALGAPQLMRLFTSYDEEMIEIGALAIRMQCLAMPSVAWVIVVNMLYAGLGRAVGAAILSVVRQGVFFIPMVLILPKLFGVQGLAAVQGVADILTLLLSIPLSILLLREINGKIREQQQASVNSEES